MIADARAAGLPDRLAADVAIVGGGAAGIALALTLAGSGMSVVLLEAGAEQFAAVQQDLYRGDVASGSGHAPAHLYRQRRWGGSTALWGGRCIPFDGIDFARRDWMAAAQWPVAAGEVAAFVPAALALAQAGLPEFDAATAFPASPPPIVDGVASPDVLLDRIERFSPPLHFGRAYRAAIAAAPDLRVLTHAPVTRILVAPDGTTRGVRIAVADRTVEITAPRVVLAAGGIETARLLLASPDAEGCALGNRRDLVGRFYQCHLEGEAGLLRFLAPARIGYERTRDGVYGRRYIALSPAAQQRDRLAGLVVRPSHVSIVDPAHRHPVLSAMFLAKRFIVPEYARKMTALEHRARTLHRSSAGYHAAHVRNVALGAPSLAGFAAHWVRRRILATRKLPSVVLADPRNVYPADINAEQEPHRDSRITLGEARDALGLPRVRIDWRATEADYRRLATGLRTIAAAFAASDTVRYDLDGVDEAMLRASIVPIGGHHIGTARMAESPRDGVCDRNGEVFTAPGLFVASAAAFPTSSFANPTLTLIALTLRLAAYLRAVPPRRGATTSP